MSRKLFRLVLPLFATPEAAAMTFYIVALSVCHFAASDGAVFTALHFFTLVVMAGWVAYARLYEARSERYNYLAFMAFLFAVVTILSIVMGQVIPRDSALARVDLAGPVTVTLHLLTSLYLIIFTIRRFGGGVTITATDKALSLNRLTPWSRANTVLLGWRCVRRRALVSLVSSPRLGPHELVIGMAPHWSRRPVTWLFASPLLDIRARLGGRQLLTPFDPRPLVTAEVKTGVLFVAGAGGGKTQSQITNLILSESSKILIETQGNALDKDVPILRHAKRTPYLFDAKLGSESASLNVLAGLDPYAEDFANKVFNLAAAIMERGRPHRHPELQHIAYELISVVLVYEVALAAEKDRDPDIARITGYLSSPAKLLRIVDMVAKHDARFRSMAERVREAVTDPRMRRNVAALWAPRLQFLSEPGKAALLNGKTGTVVDPNGLLKRHDWDAILQMPQAEIEPSGALLRLLVQGLLQPRLDLTAEEAKRPGDPGVLFYIDELAALGGSQLLDEVVVFHRQKNVRFFYNMQSVQQVEELYGRDAFGKWATSADVKIFGKISESEFERYVAPELGDTVRRRAQKMTEHGGGPNSYSINWERVPLLEASSLVKAPAFTSVVLARAKDGHTVKMLLTMPAAHLHPCLSAFRKAALKRFRKKTERARVAKAKQAKPAAEAVNPIPAPGPRRLLSKPTPSPTRADTAHPTCPKTLSTTPTIV